jgi:predicted nuclease of predicted toxin-antitoxin system
MRFLADMNISMLVVEWLRSQSFDTWHLREKGLQRLENGEIFRRAGQEGRIVLTWDLDFSEIVASTGGNASVIVFRLRVRVPQHMIRRLSAVLEESAAALEHGAIIMVEDTRYRVRLLPLRRLD